MKSSHMPSLYFLYRFGIFFQLAKLDNLPNDRSTEVHSGKQKKVIDLLRLRLISYLVHSGRYTSTSEQLPFNTCSTRERNQDAFSQVNLETFIHTDAVEQADGIERLQVVLLATQRFAHGGNVSTTKRKKLKYEQRTKRMPKA